MYLSTHSSDATLPPALWVAAGLAMDELAALGDGEAITAGFDVATGDAVLGWEPPVRTKREEVGMCESRAECTKTTVLGTSQACARKKWESWWSANEGKA